jgi:hypothetical protein
MIANNLPLETEDCNPRAKIGHNSLSAIELERIAPLAEAARLRGVSEDTLRRTSPQKIVQLAPRRLGMRVKHALMLEE